MRKNTIKHSHAIQGFTLIEIIIAMAIVAIAVLSIAGAMNQHTKVASELEKRVVASWVAANVAAETRHLAKSERIRVGTSSDVVDMGGHKWRASSHISTTDVNNVFMLRVEVKDERARHDTDYATLVTAINGS
ncbi:MAG: type II secretion system minor pseudopilin GspI [Acidiferrobacterales bacterium]|nr:type II secretion system minor pseudopilin GspI [Acidiferrobacterales bacterium]